MHTVLPQNKLEYNLSKIVPRTISNVSMIGIRYQQVFPQTNLKFKQDWKKDLKITLDVNKIGIKSWQVGGQIVLSGK